MRNVIYYLITASVSLLCYTYISSYLQFERRISSLTKTLEYITTEIQYDVQQRQTRFENDRKELKDLRNQVAQFGSIIQRSQSVNLAQDTLGGRVIEVSGLFLNLPKCPFASIREILGSPCCPACKILKSGTVPSGDCIAFQGAKASFIIKLMEFAHIESISLEHIPVSQSPTGEISSAPKEFSVSAIAENGKEIYLAGFIYALPGEHVQEFRLVQPTRKAFNTVRINFKTNHGHPEYTCVYRIRIHGILSPKN